MERPSIDAYNILSPRTPKASIDESRPSQLLTIEKMIASFPAIDKDSNFQAGMMQYMGNKTNPQGKTINPDRYENPTKRTITDTTELCAALATENPQAILDNADELGLLKFRTTEDPNVAIFAHPNSLTYPVTIAWRFGEEAKTCILQLVHEGYDGTHRVGLEGFLAIPVRAMIINALHPHTSKTGAPGQKKSHLADGAHNIKSLYSETCKSLFEIYTNKYCYMQIHGWSSKQTILVSSQHSKSFPDQKHRHISALIADGFAVTHSEGQCAKVVFLTKNLRGEAFNKPYLKNNPNAKPSEGVFRSPAKGFFNSCVEAHVVNGGGATYTGPSDRGLFAHLECGNNLRKTAGKKNRKRLFAALEHAIDLWEAQAMPDRMVTIKKPSILTSYAGATMARASKMVSSNKDPDDQPLLFIIAYRKTSTFMSRI